MPADRHRPRRRPPDVGVVSAVRPVADESAGVMDGRDNGDIRQVRAAGERVVDDRHVARSQRPQPLPHSDEGCWHGAQVDRDVSRLRQQLARRVKQGAGEVAPLFDVCRKRNPLKRDSHFLRRSFEEVAHQLELDGVDVHTRMVCDSAPFAHTARSRAKEFSGAAQQHGLVFLSRGNATRAGNATRRASHDR